MTTRGLIFRALRGDGADPRHYHARGMLVSVGTLRGVGSLLGARIAGAPARSPWHVDSRALQGPVEVIS